VADGCPHIDYVQDCIYKIVVWVFSEMKIPSISIQGEIAEGRPGGHKARWLQ